MNIYETIKERRSVRSFRNDPISQKVLNKIIEAATMAPSAHNSQEYKLVVIREGEKKRALARASSQRFMREAPVIIAAVSLNPEHIMDSGIPAYPIDIAIALDHLTLAAVEEDLGTCWIGAFSQEEVKKILNVPLGYKVVALMPIGYPYDDPVTKKRKKINEIVCEESFS